MKIISYILNQRVCGGTITILGKRDTAAANRLMEYLCLWGRTLPGKKTVFT